MKLNITILLLSVLFFSKCHIEKRKYRSGFYIHNNKNHTDYLLKQNSTNDIYTPYSENEKNDEKNTDSSNSLLIKTQTSSIKSKHSDYLINDNNNIGNFAHSNNNISSEITDSIEVQNNEIDYEEEKRIKRNSWLYLIFISVLVLIPVYNSFIMTFGYALIKSLLYFIPVVLIDYLAMHRKIKSNKNKKIHWASISSIISLLLITLVQHKYTLTVNVILNAMPFLFASVVFSIIALVAIKKNPEKYRWDLLMKYSLVISSSILLLSFFGFYVFY